MVVVFTPRISHAADQTIFFTENFDDTNFTARGWYDSTGGTIDFVNYAPPPLATSNSPTFGHPNSPRQDVLIIS